MKKKTFTTLAAIGLTIALTACAPNGSTAPTEVVPETAPTQTAETPTPTPTQREPEPVTFSDSLVAWSDIDAVLERGDIPVLLLPEVVGARITIVGVPEGWSSIGDAWRAQVFAEENGNLVITPGTTYDPYREPGEKDFVNGGDGSGEIVINGGRDSIYIEGVRP